VVESEMVFDRAGNFDGGGGIGGLSMRDRQNHHDGRIVRWALDCQHDHARAIFSSFHATRFTLVVPQIGIRNDKTRLGRGYRHAPGLFFLEHRIEMPMPMVHARGRDRLDPFVGKLGRREAATAVLEAAEFFVLIRRNEIAGDGPVARYCDRLSLCEHAVAAEVPGEFRGWDGVGHVSDVHFVAQ